MLRFRKLWAYYLLAQYTDDPSCEDKYDLISQVFFKLSYEKPRLKVVVVIVQSCPAL